MLIRPLERTRRLAGAGLRATASLVRGRVAATGEIVEALGELRGLAAKVGQMASYIEGMTPDDPAARAVFARLRANARESDVEDVRAIIEDDLGPIHARLERFDDAPLASASLGQVHSAAWLDGSEVVVKVQHPGIREAVQADLGSAERIGAFARPLARGIDVESLLDEVKARLDDELDYEKEATSQEAYRLAFEADPDLIVPRVVARSSRVLVSERAWGADLETFLASAPVESRRRAAGAIWRLFVAGAARTGLLHGDPHPGNFLFQPDGRVVALDFGCVQPLDPAALVHLRRILAEAAAGRVDLGPICGEGPAVDALAAVWSACLVPLCQPIATLDRAHSAALGEALRASKRPAMGLRRGSAAIPPWVLIANRTWLGLASVLHRFEVEVALEHSG